MDAGTKPPTTVDEFLAWDDEQEFWHEFDGENVIEVEGCTFTHAVIVSNLICELGNQLDARPYHAIGGGFRLRAGPAVRRPDVQVYRMPMDGSLTISDQAVVVFEVLSDATARTDRYAKTRDYWATPAIQQYVLVEPDFIGAVVLSRSPSSWTRMTVEQGGVLELSAIEVRLPLAEVYHRAALPSGDEA